MDSGTVTCAVFLVAALAGGVILLYHQSTETRRASERLRTARESYQQALSRLKQRPTDPNLRERALLLGREYSKLTRDSKRVTVFDEVALSNDLNAACAGAGQPTTQSIEERLTYLRGLFDRGVITEPEYQNRRSKLLDDI